MTANPALLASGYAPSVLVAKAIHRDLSTVHRMIDEGVIVALRDGRNVYVSLASLEHYFRDKENHIMVQEVRTLASQLRRFGEEEKRAVYERLPFPMPTADKRRKGVPRVARRGQRLYACASRDERRRAFFAAYAGKADGRGSVSFRPFAACQAKSRHSWLFADGAGYTRSAAFA